MKKDIFAARCARPDAITYEALGKNRAKPTVVRNNPMRRSRRASQRRRGTTPAWVTTIDTDMTTMSAAVTPAVALSSSPKRSCTAKPITDCIDENPKNMMKPAMRNGSFDASPLRSVPRLS